MNYPEDLKPRLHPAPKTQALYEQALNTIPGGTGLLSKRPEQFAPGAWPAYFSAAQGCEVTDLDGNVYVDMSLGGILACPLGYADPDVNAAVCERINRGNMSTLNPPEEVELAQRLCELHPWAKEVRFTRSGGEISTVAVRIARATTGRDKVAISGYHGWHDWYLAACLPSRDSLAGHLFGLDPYGVPKALNGLTQPFLHNDFESFDKMIREHGEDLACVIMEPMRNEPPLPGFLEHVKSEAHRVGALLIFDEISIGFRLALGGAHLTLGVNPDIAVFAKALGNGFPIGAVIGSSAAMEGAHKSFISSTYWTEAIGPTAALATLKKMAATRSWEQGIEIGRKVLDIWAELAKRYDLPIALVDTNPAMPRFKFTVKNDQYRTLFTLYMLAEGYLAGTAFNPMLTHTDEVLAAYRKAVERTFAKLRRVIDLGCAEELVSGKEARSGFGRLVR